MARRTSGSSDKFADKHGDKSPEKSGDKSGAQAAPITPVNKVRAAIVAVAVLVVVGLLTFAFVRALPDAVERQHTGRMNRIRAVCQEPLRPEAGNPVLGPLPADAPDFTLPDYLGKSVQLSSLRGRVVLVNFWFSTCPPCIAEVPSLEQLVDYSKKKPLTLLAVSVDPDWPTVRKFFSKGTNLTVLLDSEKTIPPKYGTDKFPETYIIDKDGKVLFYVVADRDWSTPAMRACLDAIVE